MNPSHVSLAQKFVDSDNAVKYFRHCLSYIKRNLPVKHMVEWNGGPGIGKTSLVKKLMQECCDVDEMSWTHVDFKRAKDAGKDYYFDPTMLIEDMLSEFQTDQMLDTCSIEHAIESYRCVRPAGDFVDCYLQLKSAGSTALWQEAMDRVCAAILETIEKLGKTRRQVRPVVIFIDETESIDYELANWFEEVLLSRFVLQDYCLVVWTGRRRWRWRRPEVRNQLVRNELDHFERDDVEDFINQNYSELVPILMDWVDAIHLLSGGHGYSVALGVNVLARWLTAHPGKTPSDGFQSIECTLLSVLRKDFVLDYAFEGIEERIVDALEALALLRSLDANLVSHVVLDTPVTLSDGSFEEVIELLDQLKKTDLLIWNKTSYALGDDVRHVLSSYYRKCEPDKYAKIHSRAVSAYSEMLEKAQDNLNLFVIEKQYHLAALSQVSGDVNLEREFENHLSDYLINITDRDFLRSTLAQLQDMLENDNELAVITEGRSRNALIPKVQAFTARLSS